jgi:hypothetical protein
VIGDDFEDPHPGIWPIPEMAVALIEGMKDFVAYGMENAPGFDPSWFDPRPYETWVHLISTFPLMYPTWPSEHRLINQLTRHLHEYLQGRGLLDTNLTLSWENQGYDPADYD